MHIQLLQPIFNCNLFPKFEFTASQDPHVLVNDISFSTLILLVRSIDL